MTMFMRGRMPLALLSTLTTLAILSGGAAAGEMRRVEGLEFDHVDVVGAVKVEISQGDDAQLQMYGTTSDLDREPFRVDGDRLILGSDARGNERGLGDMKYRVVLPSLQELHLKGSGQVYVKPLLLVDSSSRRPASFSVEGSGDLKLYGIEGPAIELRVKGSGDIKAVEVIVESIEGVVAGSGDLYFQDLQAKVAELTVTGSGDIKVTDGGFIQTLEANVIGSGEIDLRSVGTETVEANIVGSGDIELGEVMSSIQGAILGSGDVRYDGDPVVDTVELGSGECRQRN